MLRISSILAAILRSRRLWRALCVILALVAVWVPAPSRADEALITTLKAAYLYNFTKFIDWPPESLGKRFVIAVAGDEALTVALRTLERQRKQVKDLPIEIRALEDKAKPMACQILVIGRGAQGRLDQLLQFTAGEPVLTVGDAPGLTSRGVAINFTLRGDILGEGQRLRFQINPSVLKGRGLKVSAELYDVAEIIP